MSIKLGWRVDALERRINTLEAKLAEAEEQIAKLKPRRGRPPKQPDVTIEYETMPDNFNA